MEQSSGIDTLRRIPGSKTRERVALCLTAFHLPYDLSDEIQTFGGRRQIDLPGRQVLLSPVISDQDLGKKK
jgi:hypothetical protein